MTRSVDFLRDLQPSEDKVKIVNDSLIEFEGYVSSTVVFLNKVGGETVRHDRVAYVPDLAFNIFFLDGCAHVRSRSHD